MRKSQFGEKALDVNISRTDDKRMLKSVSNDTKHMAKGTHIHNANDKNLRNKTNDKNVIFNDICGHYSVKYFTKKLERQETCILLSFKS